MEGYVLELAVWNVYMWQRSSSLQLSMQDSFSCTSSKTDIRLLPRLPSTGASQNAHSLASVKQSVQGSAMEEMCCLHGHLEVRQVFVTPCCDMFIERKHEQ